MGGHLCWQVWSADLNDSANLWARFQSNVYVGAGLTAAIIAAKLTA
jgi:hypothetical protein